MSHIDYTALITPQIQAVEAQLSNAMTVKAECAAHIEAVLDPRTVPNLHGAILTGALSDDQLACFGAGQHWVQAMQAACRSAIALDNTPDWPPVPEGLTELAALY